MRTYTQEELKAMTMQQAQSIVNQAVYDATRLIEDLERAGKLSGNGHHHRQDIGEYAAAKVQERWRIDVYAA